MCGVCVRWGGGGGGGGGRFRLSMVKTTMTKENTRFREETFDLIGGGGWGSGLLMTPIKGQTVPRFPRLWNLP